MIDDVYLVNSENMKLPDGWRCVDGPLTDALSWTMSIWQH